MNLVYHKKLSAIKMRNYNYNAMVENTNKIMKDVAKNFKVKRIQSPVEKFIERVCAYSKVTPQEVKSKSRAREYVLPRQIMMKIIKQNYNKTLRHTGELFNRDHATVLNAINVVNNLLEFDKKFRNIYLEIFNLQHHEPLNNN